MKDRRASVPQSLEKLIKYIEAQNYEGYDPYDALNSLLLRRLSLNRKYLRILFIQTLKRLPINLRPLLGIEKGLNPKALGLFLWGYAKLFSLEKKETYLAAISRLLDLLQQTKSDGYSGHCWGYNFDWQSRAFFVPRGTPTIVNSAFIGHALIDTFCFTGMQQALDLALPIKEFILRDLNRTKEGDTICFSYTPIDQLAVHNANLLGASLLIRLHKYDPDEVLRHSALVSLAFGLNHQNEDGSWYYGEKDYQRWIDSFHTGFNLQSILYFHEEGYAEECGDRLMKGVDFYRNRFFLKDGTPKYYHNATYPIDVHSPTQAMVFFSKMGPSHRNLAEAVLNWMIENMQDSSGYFYFRKTRQFTNKIPYMRWGQAWAFHALTEFILSESTGSSV